jgi:hypothetical protein
MQRRKFIAGLGSAVACPLAAEARRPGLRIVPFVSGLVVLQVGSSEAEGVRAFAKGLGERAT